MDRFAFLFATGLARGAVFALFALSLVLIWRATRIINFAQGAMALVATYVAFAISGLTGSYFAGLAAGVLAGAALGFLVERGVMRFAPQSSPLTGVLAAIGLVMVFQSLLGIFFGAQYRAMASPFDRGAIVVGGVPLMSPNDLFTLAVTFVVMVVLALVFARTSLGLQLRAAAFAPDVSRLLGVRVNRMVTVGWILSSAVAALAAILLVPTELGLNPHATDMLFVYAFAVAVIGGLDSPVGALLGGLSVGVAMSLLTGYLGATAAPIGVLLILILVLLVKPSGIFSTGKERGA